jgi:outer membrane protein TolC
LPSDLLKRRPDVQKAEAQLIAANATTKYNIASVYPSISLTAQGGVESNALRTLFDPVGAMFSIGASLLQPVFKGDALEGGIDLSKARFKELSFTYQKTVVSAFQDVENALVAVEMTGKQEEAQKAAVATAQHAQEIVLAQMRSGTVDILTVLNVQRTLFQAQDQLVQVKLAHVQALVQLFLALGGGWSV